MKKNDTLSEIAEHFGTTVAKLAARTASERERDQGRPEAEDHEVAARMARAAN
ncbi:LysM peptidoglycan-binding domain-containing protein [Streptomyces sp. T1317-0309]|nr:LysM peptidoglycan-binding domain-containing protein [Streptomyces sp. T1317-0309]